MLELKKMKGYLFYASIVELMQSQIFSPKKIISTFKKFIILDIVAT